MHVRVAVLCHAVQQLVSQLAMKKLFTLLTNSSDYSVSILHTIIYSTK